MTSLATRRLGRTNRQVTTLGLGGQGSIQWPGKGIDPVAIIEKAVRLGITYLDTSNIYGPSQYHFGKAFRRLGLVPGMANYDSRLREKIFLASKTHFRTARRPKPGRVGTLWTRHRTLHTLIIDTMLVLQILLFVPTDSMPSAAKISWIE